MNDILRAIEDHTAAFMLLWVCIMVPVSLVCGTLSNIFKSTPHFNYYDVTKSDGVEK